MPTIAAEPFEATCLDGIESEFTIDVFTRSADEVTCGTICKAVKDLFDDGQLTFAGAHTLALDWVRTQIIRDAGDADVWHGLVTMSAQTSDDF